MAVNRLFLSNLPFGVSEVDLRTRLLLQFPGFFNRQTLRVRVYEVGYNARNQQRQVATAWGLQLDLSLLKQSALGKTFQGKNWRFAEDFGEERDATGNFLRPLTGVAARERARSRGEMRRKPMEVFVPAFLDGIGRNVFKGTNVVCVRGIDATERNFIRAGDVESTKRISKEGIQFTVVRFLSSLEALQAIMLYNGDGITFVSDDGKISSSSNHMSGIGNNGQVINLRELSTANGYVPFRDLKTGVIDIGRIQSFRSRCWRCKGAFQLLGIDLNLNFVAGRCACQAIGREVVDRNLDILDVSRAYCFPGENFTRLFLSSDSDGFGETRTRTSSWKIFHQPLAAVYTSPQAYRNIVAPVCQEEWKSYSTAFKEENRTTGTLMEAILTESDPTDHGIDTYLVRMRVRKEKVWKEEEQFQISGMTLNMTARNRKNGAILEERRKAKICSIRELNLTHVLVSAKFDFPHLHQPVLGTVVNITPKAIKSTYKQLLQVLSRWVRNPQAYTSLSFILDGQANVDLDTRVGELKMQLGMYQRCLVRMKHSLNERQNQALERAIISPVSVVKGPPGTGKTYTASILINVFRLTEKGHIIAAAASNYACDGLARMVRSTATKFGVPIKILRIYSYKRQTYYRSGRPNELSGEIPVLHELVEQSPNWLQGGGIMASVRQKVNLGREDEFTADEQNAYKDHVMEIEFEIMATYHVFVATVNTLTDKRIRKYNGKQRKITTVLLDEIGTVFQVNTLPALLFDQVRVVFCGDNQQLRGVTHSFSAEIARLNFSVMDWSEGRTNIPCTMLNVQFRMHPDIRNLVSTMTYNGELLDAPSVLSRPTTVSDLITAFGAPLQSRVLVFDHSTHESPGGPSFYNVGEIKLCLAIIKRMVELNISLKKVVVLTLYEAQRRAMTEKLKSYAIKICNVDAYQGRESDIVILSTVRSNSSAGLGFASNQNRLNVALSRAKELLIILCDTSTFRRYKTGPISIILDFMDQKQVEKRSLSETI